MSVSSLFALLLKSSLVTRLIRYLGGGLLGLTVLGYVVEQSGPATGEVIVHVMEPDVQVNVGGKTYYIGANRYVVIECELRRGWHELTMSRDGQVLFRQEFKLRGGGSQVLTAYAGVPHYGLADPAGPRGAD